MKNKLLLKLFVLLFGVFSWVSLSAQEKKGKDTLRWEPVPFSTGYILQIKDKKDKIVVNTKTTKTTYDVKKLKRGGTYFYRISILNRLGVVEATSKWVRFQVTQISIPSIKSLDKNTFPAKKKATIEAKGRLFDKKNTLFITRMKEEKKEEETKKKIGKSRRKQNKKKKSVNLQTEVESPDSMKIFLPGSLEEGNYKFSFLHKSGEIYPTNSLLHITKALRTVSYRFLALPSFYIPVQSPAGKLFTLGFGLDLHFGIREAKEFEIGVSLGAYTIGGRRDKAISSATYLPVAVYFGYGVDIKGKFELFPYFDLGLDSYFINPRDGFADQLSHKYYFLPRMNIGMLFTVKRKRLLITTGFAVNMTYSKKFAVTALLLNAGVGVAF